MALATELTQTELEALFAQLAEQWHDETGMHSVMHRIVGHPAYLRIIGLGPRAIPLIIGELKTRGGWWFVALEALTGEDPTDPADAQDYNALAESWLAWAERHGAL